MVPSPLPYTKLLSPLFLVGQYLLHYSPVSVTHVRIEANQAAHNLVHHDGMVDDEVV